MSQIIQVCLTEFRKTSIDSGRFYFVTPINFRHIFKFEGDTGYATAADVLLDAGIHLIQ